mgnify:CR=1 FL=1
MVSRTNQKNIVGGITDIREVRIKHNLMRLVELVSSSSELKERTGEYLDGIDDSGTPTSLQVET